MKNTPIKISAISIAALSTPPRIDIVSLKFGLYFGTPESALLPEASKPPPKTLPSGRLPTFFAGLYQGMPSIFMLAIVLPSSTYITFSFFFFTLHLFLCGYSSAQTASSKITYLATAVSFSFFTASTLARTSLFISSVL